MAQYQSFPDAAGDSLTLEKLKSLQMPDLKGRSFLDVGCNEGFFCGFARFQGASRVVGIDHSRQFIERARRRFEGCEFLAQGWDSLPEGKFDVVLLASALHYAEDQPALIGRLVELLAPNGVLVLELGIASSPNDEWVTVKRGIDERQFPTMAKLRNILDSYAWKWMGPSVSQAGDPVSRHVLHISRRRPIAYLLMEPPGYGKSSVAAGLFVPAGIPVISGDTRLDQAARGKTSVSDELQPYLKEYSPFALDKLIEGVFNGGLWRELLDLWMEPANGKDFALEVYVPSGHQHRIVDGLIEAGYFPITLNWSRIGPASMASEALAEQAEAFYLSLGDVDNSDSSSERQAPREQQPDFVPAGFVDEVSLGDGKLSVRGWAINSKGHLPARFLIRIGRQMLEVGQVEKQLRPDVQRHLALPHALVGYRFALPLDKEAVRAVASGFECLAPEVGPSPLALAGPVAAQLGLNSPPSPGAK